MKDILLKREYLAYMMGGLTAIAVTEVDSFLLLTALMLFVGLVGFPAIRKYGT